MFELKSNNNHRITLISFVYSYHLIDVTKLLIHNNDSNNKRHFCLENYYVNSFSQIV